MNKIIVLHHDDRDGRGAAAVISEAFNIYDPNQFIELNYIDPIPVDRIEEDAEVWIVDYSITDKNIDAINEILLKTSNVIWIDHHKASFNSMKEYAFLNILDGIRSNDFSGMALTYMYIHKVHSIEECPNFVRFIDDYDRFQFKLPETMCFQYGLATYPYGPTDMVWKKLFAQDLSTMNNIIESGKIINTYMIETQKKILKDNAFETEIEGYSCLAISHCSDSFIFGDKINNYDICCVFTYIGDRELFKYTIYTNKENEIKGKIDCNAIANKFGGGGHAGAAGFSSKKLIFKK
jgi:oligoribonuclease NrnB/cAMP/cGMP phosphodiesterase (DHH superfamily)